MKTNIHDLFNSSTLDEMSEAYCNAIGQGEHEPLIQEYMLLGTALRLFTTVGEEGTKAMFRAAMRDLENGDFKRMREGEGVVDWGPHVLQPNGLR